MEYRIRRLIKDYGDYNNDKDIDGIYRALQEAIRYDLNEVSNEIIKDMVMDLRKCDSCEEYEHEMFTSLTTAVRSEDGGDWGRVCITCRGNG
jgi:hypothetical protein